MHFKWQTLLTNNEIMKSKSTSIQKTVSHLKCIGNVFCIEILYRNKTKFPKKTRMYDPECMSFQFKLNWLTVSSYVPFFLVICLHFSLARDHYSSYFQHWAVNCPSILCMKETRYILYFCRLSENLSKCYQNA